MSKNSVIRRSIKWIAGTSVVAAMIAAPSALFGQNYEPTDGLFEQETIVVPEQADQDQPTVIDEGASDVDQQPNADQDTIVIEQDDIGYVPGDDTNADLNADATDQSDSIGFAQDEGVIGDQGTANVDQQDAVTQDQNQDQGRTDADNSSGDNEYSGDQTDQSGIHDGSLNQGQGSTDQGVDQTGW
ncbi:hypothetical protein JD969_05325 [Planctomycetota bacterium]|nr:hypothetical protein JD969_05325 [Planctomycetota bacterium]